MITNEEAIKILNIWKFRASKPTENQLGWVEGWVEKEDAKALDMAIEALKFAQWVAEEVIDEDLWELNHGAFAEIACRKLEKLGIVKSNDGYWEMSK